MMDLSRRIRELRDRMGITRQADLAKLVGVDQATVSRWESGKQEPEGDSLIRLARLAKMSVEEFIQASTVKPLHVVNVSVIGKVQAGEWVEALKWSHEDQYDLTMPPNKKYPNIKRFGLEVGGPSMDRVYPEGTILLCVSFDDLGRDPLPGERVIVERRRENDLLEVTVKEYVPDTDGRVWLWPRSTHPEFQQPLPLPQPGDANGTEDVRISALVVGRFTEE